MLNDSKLARFILLPELQLIKIYQKSRATVFECEKIKTAFEICPRCANKATMTYDHVTTTVRDEPLRRSDCIFKIRKRRLYCRTCKKVFTETVPGILPRRRTTQRLRRAIIEAAQKFSSLKSVVETFHCSTSFVYQTVFEQIELKLREYQYPWPKVVGIDEHFFRRENEHRRYFTVFIDIKNHRVREALLGKKVENLEKDLEHIEGREKVEWAVMDLSSTYRRLSREHFPNAKVVADKFHVLRLFTQALRYVRIQTKVIDGEREKFPPLRLMLKSRKDLDYFKRQELDRELKKYPAIDEAYRIKEESMSMYRVKGEVRAKRAFLKLLERVRRSQDEPLKRLAKTLDRWREPILNHFTSGLTNAMTEGFNRVASLVKNRGFGYRNPKNYRLRFLSACL